MLFERDHYCVPANSGPANQCGKLRSLAKPANIDAIYNLDDYKTAAIWGRVVEHLQSLLDITSAVDYVLPTVVLFTSPQTVCNPDKPWLSLILKLGDQKMVRLQVLDEFHLVCEQGLLFRPVFGTMGKKVISKIMEKNPRCPLMALTATSTLQDIALVEQEITGVSASKLMQATPKEMQRRVVTIELHCRTTWSPSILVVLTHAIKDPDKPRFIVFCNYKSDVKPALNQLRDLCDKLLRDGKVRIIEIDGDQASHQKAFNVDMFCNNVLDDDEREISRACRGMVGTTGCCCTGIDPFDTRVVAQQGCPQALLFGSRKKVGYGEQIVLLQREPIRSQSMWGVIPSY